MMSNRLLTTLWLVGVFVCFLDLPAIMVGGSTLKIAYIVFPLLFPFVLYHKEMQMDKRHIVLGTLFFVSTILSVVLSTNVLVSLEFLFGVGVCLLILESMYGLTRALGQHTVDMLVWFYRMTVMISLILFVTGIQERAHFTLYEASYWAIALIPYYSIAFHRLLTHGQRAFYVDGIFILTAIVISKSVSMFAWSALALLGVIFAMNKVKIRTVVVTTIAFILFVVVAYQLNARTKRIVDSISADSDWTTVGTTVAFIGGNRLQKTLIAYRAWHDHPIFGVGVGALGGFSYLHYREDDFTIAGRSAADFDTEGQATNIFLELAAECGVIGLLTFLLLLHFVFKQSKNRPELIPFRVALLVTMISLMIESSYLRPYVWMLYGISLGLSSLHAPVHPKRLLPRIRLLGFTQTEIKR